MYSALFVSVVNTICGGDGLAGKLLNNILKLIEKSDFNTFYCYLSETSEHPKMIGYRFNIPLLLSFTKLLGETQYFSLFCVAGFIQDEMFCEKKIEG